MNRDQILIKFINISVKMLLKIEETLKHSLLCKRPSWQNRPMARSRACERASPTAPPARGSLSEPKKWPARPAYQSRGLYARRAPATQAATWAGNLARGRHPPWVLSGPNSVDRPRSSDRIRRPSTLLADQNRPTAGSPKP